MRLSLATACLSLFAFALGGGPIRAQQVQPPNTATQPPNTAVQPRENTATQPRNPTAGGMEMEAVPEGWIRIATDTNGDGRYDRVELIHVYDLEQARQSSAQRARGDSDSQKVQDGSITVEGAIRSMHSVELQGFEGEHQEHQLARLKTEEGHNIRVDLGPKATLSKLNLKEGQTISVQGTIGSIDDRPVLMADRITAGSNTVKVNLPEGLGHQRFHAQVLSTRTAHFQRQDGEHLIARLRLLDGQEVEALLGPKAKLDALKIQDGDSVDLLAHPGRLNSEPVLVAEQIHVGDQVVSIDRPPGQNGRQFHQENEASDHSNPK